MFNTEKARECLRKVIGWKDHHDTVEIPALSPDLTESESNEFYQEKHPAMRLDIIKACLPKGKDLEQYLRETEDSAIVEMLNEITMMKELSKTSKELVANDVIYNSQGFRTNTIVNESRFVGIRFRPVLSIGLKAIVNRFALQLSDAQTDLKIYLYHTSKVEPIEIFDYTTTTGGQFNWQEIKWEMKADDADLSGGMFYLGYYQDDLVGQAIKYEKLNWRTGYCGSCDGGANLERYTSIAKYVNMQSFYVTSGNLDLVDRHSFDPDAVIETDTTNWGFNFNVSVTCDLTNFWCDNRMTLRNALGLRVVYRVLKDIQFSTNINYVEEQLKMMITRDLEGDKETRYINIVDQYNKALKAIKFNHSSINSVCLPCAVDSGVTYGVV